MEIYHVLNRGVDKRQIFIDKQDYLRFIHDLYEFNDITPVESSYYKFKDHVSTDQVAKEAAPKKRLVNILAFCLMPNHYHLMVCPKTENGVSLFMKKLNGGYAKYFNQKYERAGALFQGKYKSILASENEYFVYLPFYIHFNPLDLSYPSWRENNIKSPQKALEFLKSYRWSSHSDYLGIKNFPDVINTRLLREIFGDSKEYRQLVSRYLKDMRIDSDACLE